MWSELLLLRCWYYIMSCISISNINRQKYSLDAEHIVTAYCRTVTNKKYTAVALVLKNAVAFFAGQ